MTADPFPTWAAADRIATELNKTRRLLLIVEKSERSKSPFDSYTKIFASGVDGESAAEQLLAWWHSLPDHSYTRTRATVRVYDITDREREVLSPDPRDITQPAGERRDVDDVQLDFSPDVVRRRARGLGEDLPGVADELLSRVLAGLLASDDRLWEAVDDVTRLAARICAAITTDEAQ